MNKRITVYIGNDDGDYGEEQSANGEGWEVTREDAMVYIEHLEVHDGDETAYEFYIMRDLFPKIRAAMDRVDTMFE